MPRRQAPSSSARRAVGLYPPQDPAPPRVSRRPGVTVGVVRRVRQGPESDHPAAPTVAPAGVEAGVEADVVDFCRRARKLRANGKSDRARMHRELRRLTLRDDFGPFPGTDTFEAFVERTILESGEPLLRYSTRLELLTEAARRELGRFEANLAIATVQHRLHSTSDALPPRPATGTSAITLVGAVLLVQSIIATAVWAILRA